MVWNCQSLPSSYAQCKDRVQNPLLVGFKKEKRPGGGGHDDIWQGGKEKLSKQEVSEFDFSRQVGSQTVTAFSL